MSNQQQLCSKCGNSMEAGFIVDHGHANSPQVETWVEGEPRKSFWSGLKISDRLQLPVTTYRCQTCGYLEAYAVDTI
jgi:predicted nucleic-acid-binding Zn-ribbon protein